MDGSLNKIAIILHYICIYASGKVPCSMDSILLSYILMEQIEELSGIVPWQYMCWSLSHPQFVLALTGILGGWLNGDCSNSIANTLELLQSCTEPSKCACLCTSLCTFGIIFICMHDDMSIIPLPCVHPIYLIDHIFEGFSLSQPCLLFCLIDCMLSIHRDVWTEVGNALCAHKGVIFSCEM